MMSDTRLVEYSVYSESKIHGIHFLKCSVYQKYEFK
jgi:hypothetical protein